MKLDDHTKALIAVVASITANCQPCLQSTMSMALENGANEQEIAEAVEVGRRVRKGAASKMDTFLVDKLSDNVPTISTTNGCGCGAPIQAMEGKNE